MIAKGLFLVATVDISSNAIMLFARFVIHVIHVHVHVIHVQATVQVLYNTSTGTGTGSVTCAGKYTCVVKVYALLVKVLQMTGTITGKGTG